jgi:hypothetical protein
MKTLVMILKDWTFYEVVDEDENTSLFELEKLGNMNYESLVFWIIFWMLVWWFGG